MVRSGLLTLLFSETSTFFKAGLSVSEDLLRKSLQPGQIAMKAFSSTPELKHGRNEEQIFMTKVWMSLKELNYVSVRSFFILFTMKYCTISDIIRRGDDAAQLYVLKGELCGFCFIFYSYS